MTLDSTFIELVDQSCTSLLSQNIGTPMYYAAQDNMNAYIERMNWSDEQYEVAFVQAEKILGWI